MLSCQPDPGPFGGCARYLSPRRPQRRRSIHRGSVDIEMITTPGHSPDSICLCLFESGGPVALFSGDTLFAGDVGRPNLRDLEVGTLELAAMMYDSLFHKLLRLPPEVRVYPAHGAGSL